MQQAIFDAIQAALQELGIPEVDFVVERPSDLANGDYATNAALVASKKLGKSPKEFAQEIIEKLSPSTSLGIIEAIKIAGPGFINFYLSKEVITKEVAEAATKADWANNNLYTGKKVMVEFTDPNPFKEFHIGHLMSNAIGEAISRTLEAAGANVIRVNYQGDVGLHVAKAIWGYQQMGTEENPILEGKWGMAYVLGAEKYETDESAKAEIQERNKKIYERSDDEINKLYKEGREVSLQRFENIYRILGTQFTHFFFESQSWPVGVKLVHAHIKDGVFEMSDGAVVFKGEKVGLHTRVFLNSQGLPTYEAKDLGLLELKEEKENDLDLSITITANEQTEYFKVMLAAAKELPEVQDIANKTQHISHGMMRFADGKMSSRKGNFITGVSLLADMQRGAHQKMQGRELKDANKTAEQVAVGAIKFTVLKQGSGKDIVFDPEKSLSLEGDSGPYLQYALTRARSLLRKAEAEGLRVSAEAAELLAKGEAWPSGLERPESAALPLERSSLERTLIHFPEVVARAARELEPHYVTTFLTELASLFNSWYAAERVIGSADETYGLLLTKAFEQTMLKGLALLGIPAPEEM
ncbi:MAG: arginyl-tRNA synthetase [Patescibacteria group bacterium]|nr:arginyl-tRNA synthetase [Patescibacteria group bacterium]